MNRSCHSGPATAERTRVYVSQSQQQQQQHPPFLPRTSTTRRTTSTAVQLNGAPIAQTVCGKAEPTAWGTDVGAAATGRRPTESRSPRPSGRDADSPLGIVVTVTAADVRHWIVEITASTDVPVRGAIPSVTLISIDRAVLVDSRTGTIGLPHVCFGVPPIEIRGAINVERVSMSFYRDAPEPRRVDIGRQREPRAGARADVWRTLVVFSHRAGLDRRQHSALGAPIEICCGSRGQTIRCGHASDEEPFVSRRRFYVCRVSEPVNNQRIFANESPWYTEVD